MSKITKATFKSFIKNNKGNMMIRKDSDFDGMTDGIEYSKNPQFNAAEETGFHTTNTIGVDGVWLVGSSRDSFSHFEDENFTGIECYNCCGSFIIAIRKAA